MKTLTTYSAALVALAFLLAAPATAAPHRLAHLHAAARSAISLRHEVHDLRRGIAWHRSRTWHFQDEAGRHRTPTSHLERRTRSVAFLRWDRHLWSNRRVEAKRYLARHRLPYTGDWQTAVRIVQRVWPGTSSFLLNCSGAESNHGIWVWNGGAPYWSSSHGSGAGGWLQYMRSTFDAHYVHAVALARQEHLPVPPPSAPHARAGAWRESPLAQAFAGGWAYYHDINGVPARRAWTGDPACA